MANPFYIQPGADFGPGLQGLAQTIALSKENQQRRQERDETAQKFAQAKKAIMEAYRSNDPEKMLEVSLEFPELGEAVTAASRHRSTTTSDNYTDSLFEVLADPSEENMSNVVRSRQESLRLEGVGPEGSVETDSFLDKYKENPEKMMKEITNLAIMRDPTRYKDMQDALGTGELTASQKDYNFAKSEGYEGSFMDFRNEVSKAGVKDGKKQKTGAFVVRGDDGEVAIAVGSYDPTTGELETKTTGLDGYEVVSKMGETPGEQSQRRVKEQRGKTQASQQEQRAGDLIDRGLMAAESTATIRRGIELLKEVETGGVDAVKNRVKSIFGIESQEEGELSNMLGKAVLSQLRETFGAQFTESEGARLSRIEAGFGKSPAANKRLLEQTLRIAQRTAKRARKAAEGRGDMETVADIDDLLEFSLSPDASEDTPVSEMTVEQIEKALIEAQ